MKKQISSIAPLHLQTQKYMHYPVSLTGLTSISQSRLCFHKERHHTIQVKNQTLQDLEVF